MVAWLPVGRGDADVEGCLKSFDSEGKIVGRECAGEAETDDKHTVTVNPHGAVMLRIY